MHTSSSPTTEATGGGTVSSKYLVAAYKRLLFAAHTKLVEAERTHKTAQEQSAQRLLDSEAACRELEHKRDTAQRQYQFQRTLYVKVVDEMVAQDIEMSKLRRDHQDNTALAARVTSLEVELRAATLASQQKTNALEITVAKLLDDNIVRTALRDMNADMLSQIAALEQRLLTMHARHSQDKSSTLEMITGLATIDEILQTRVEMMTLDVATMRYELANLTSKHARHEVNQLRSKSERNKCNFKNA